MKTLALLSLVAYTIFSNAATAEESMERIVANVQEVCAHPPDSGKYWDVRVKGDAEAALVKLRFVDLGISGGAEFSKGEWDGVQRVLREHQAGDNESYRQCVGNLTPLFIEKFAPKPVYKLEERDRTFSFSEKNNHCDADREINIRVAAAEGWAIAEASIQPTVDTSSNSSFSGIRDISGAGFTIKGYVRNGGECGPSIGGVRVGKDARGHVWGSVKYKELREIELNTGD